LRYRKTPVRVLLSPDTAWFAATDIFAANHRRTDRASLSRIDCAHLDLKTFPSPTGPVRLTAVSPLGVATIAKELPAPLDRMLDAWVRREANQLADLHGFPRLELTLLADNTLPVRPLTHWNSYFPWQELSRHHPTVYRNAVDLTDPALFDDDPALPPHDPEGDQASFRARWGLEAAA
jgi:hypothetical protein